MPANRNNGTRPNRKGREPRSSSRRRIAATASRTRARSSRAASGPATASGEGRLRRPPRWQRRSRRDRDPQPRPGEMPETSSTTRTGVATTAWYVRSHLTPAITGYVVSLVAVCIAVARATPGATNSRYERPPRSALPTVDELAEQQADRDEKKIGFRNAARPSKARLAGRTARARRRRASGRPVMRRHQSTRRAAGEAQEDVLEGAPPDEHAFRREPALVDLLERSRHRRRCRSRSGPASPRCASPSSSSLRVEPSSCDPNRSSTTSPRRIRRSARAANLRRRSLPWSMIDEPIAELLGLVHVMRRQHSVTPCCLSRYSRSHSEVAGLRIEPGGRLVEQQKLGIVDQRPCDREPALHAAGQRLDPALAGRSAARTRAARPPASG